MRFPQKGGRIDEEKAEKQMRMAIEEGVNYFDTAWPYHGGESETFVGEVLAKDGLRGRVKLATKLPSWLVKEAGDMDRFLEKQLEFLKTDRIDYYLVHALDGHGWDSLKDLGIREFLNGAQASGRIVNRGFSFHGKPEDFIRICDEFDWDFCQIQLNYLDENYQAGIKGLSHAESRKMDVIVMEPLRGGALAGELPDSVCGHFNRAVGGRSNADWALRWVFDHAAVKVVLSGMNDEAQISENCRIADSALPGSMSRKEKDAVKAAAREYRLMSKVGCTGCGYCMPCPAGVNIPECFSLYNFARRFEYQGRYLLHLGGMEGRKPELASGCVNCG
jgi:predicted aldo/keto reductase-like oxidoreductase